MEMLPVWAILLIPLFAAIFNLCFLQRYDRAAAGVSIAAIATCLLLTLGLPFMTIPATDPHASSLLPEVRSEGSAGGARQVYLYRNKSELGAGIRAQKSTFAWAAIRPREVAGKPLPLGVPEVLQADGLEIQFGVMVDSLAWFMMLVVTGIGLLVHIFSVGYLAHEGAWGRYFAGLSLFCFSMLGIVVSPNYLQTFIFWELVGVSSYILIGHYYGEDNPPEAAKKAFMTNRVADFGFMIGILMLYFTTGTVDFYDLPGLGGPTGQYPQLFGQGATETAGTLIGILLFVGCMGKSAQFPFHIWLPDAMAGPTPVSALMHAATMVAAGVYLVLRSYPIYNDHALVFVTWIGAITALIAALIAVVQTDIKKVLAYSTLSQLGFMMVALGLGGYAAAALAHDPEAVKSVELFRSQCYTAGMFHLTTHAFFKALLFLAAGAVIVGMHHHQDMMEMGGLIRRMPYTAVGYLFGMVALAGIWPWAGFYSKDLILHLAHQANHKLYLLLSFAAFLTAFYMGRSWFLTFAGEARSGHADHAEEVDASMVVPLFVLAFLSITTGWWGQYGMPGFVEDMATKSFGEVIYLGVPWQGHIEWGVAAVSLGLSGVAFGLAYIIYGAGIISPDGLKERFSWLHEIVSQKFYCDHIANFLVEKVQNTVAIVLDLIEQNLLIEVGIYRVCDAVRWVGSQLRYSQTGNVRDYATMLLFGVLFLVLWVTASSPAMTGLGG